MEHSSEPEQSRNMAEELITLYSSGGKLYNSTPAESLERQDQGTLERVNMYGIHNSYAETSKVHFGESAYNISEQELYASKVASECSKDALFVR